MKQKFTKKPILRLMAVLITALFLIINLSAYQTVKSQVKQIKTQTKSTVDMKLVIPDLIVQDFWINKAAMKKQNNLFSVPFNVRIKNIGTGNVKNIFYLSFQKRPFVEGSNPNPWQGERDSLNCRKINNLLKKGESVLHAGILWIRNYEISDKTLEVRVMVDTGCNEEFPPSYGHVKELKENNNVSNSRVISKAYFPHITSIEPSNCVRNEDEVRISGTGFGSTQGNHVVKVRKSTDQVKAIIKSWHTGIIYFKVPSNCKLGNCKVSIADKSTMSRYSNEIGLRVIRKKVLAWNTIIDAWNIFKDYFKIHLNNKGSGANVNNTSYLRLITQRPIALKKVEFSVASLGSYRFLVKDMDTTEGGLQLTKSGCSANQLKLIASFESEGKEMKGYFKAVLGGGWNDDLAPDIQVNNAKIYITFNFGSSQNVQLDFSLNVNFTGSVNASGSTWDKILDTFMGGWDTNVKDKIKSGVKQALEVSQNKNAILNDLNKLIKLLTGISSSNTIVEWEFKNNGIHISYF